MSLGRKISILLLSWIAAGASAQGAPGSLDELLAQARTDATAEQHRRGQRFLDEQALQQTRLQRARRELEAEKARSRHLQQAFEKNEDRLEELDARLHKEAGGLMDLFGVARQSAGDALALFRDSLISSQFPGRAARVGRLAGDDQVPAMSELEDLWIALLQEMTESAKVVRYRAPVVGPDGTSRERTVTRVGVFEAVAAGRFLRYLPETGTLEELPRQPSAGQRRLAEGLEKATRGLHPMVIDPSRGVVLALLSQIPSPLERIRQGKAIGYVIIALAAIGMLLALGRWLHLGLVGRRMRGQLARETPDPNNPLGRVMAVREDHPGADTETLDLLLDEAILREIPGLRRGLPALKILAAVAPLLGLLGTVVGLIQTFQSITLFGTGDPKLMAGGISQALVTTVLGLGAAIPLILLHSVLSGKSRRLVEILEEQSAGIVARHAEKRRPHAPPG